MNVCCPALHGLCYHVPPTSLQITNIDIPNYIVWATSSSCTKPRALILGHKHWIYQIAPSELSNQLHHHSTKEYHDTTYGSNMSPFKQGSSYNIPLFCTSGTSFYTNPNHQRIIPCNPTFYWWPNFLPKNQQRVKHHPKWPHIQPDVTLKSCHRPY